MNGERGFTIVVGVDGSAPSRLVLEWAVTEARQRQVQVRAVTAWASPPAPLTPTGYPSVGSGHRDG